MLRSHIKMLVAALAVFSITACSDDGWPVGDLVVTNSDPADTLVSIYISTDCTDSWGNPDYTGLTIAPGASSGKYELETRTYDVLACFDADLLDDLNPLSCGQVLGIEVHDHGTAVASVADQGIVAAPATCL